MTERAERNINVAFANVDAFESGTVCRVARHIAGTLAVADNPEPRWPTCTHVSRWKEETGCNARILPVSLGMPRPIQAMLASAAGELPPLKGWTIEPKWDGIRVIAEVTTRRVHLWSRNGIDKASGFPEIVAALEAMRDDDGSMVLDGELVAVGKGGKPLRFQALQQRGQVTTRTALVVFDCLAARGDVLTAEAWRGRRSILASIVSAAAKQDVRLGASSPCGSAGAKRLLAAAQKEGWEGLIAKQMDAPYIPGKRSPFWRKVKFEHEQEFVIGGYTLPTEGTGRQHVGALLVGYYDDAGVLQYAGKVGTGYTRKTLEMLGNAFAKIAVGKCPFANIPRAKASSEWVRPVLVAQIRYNEITDAGILRQPVFLGLRDDKRAKDVHLEEQTGGAALADIMQCGGARLAER
ncbi:MAG: polymerase LigD, ligase domain protein [Gemmatimonadetes bacterium]|nr:polymerase LigD, ligase domain protein [Gemmatimonadota bacterium]